MRWEHCEIREGSTLKHANNAVSVYHYERFCRRLLTVRSAVSQQFVTRPLFVVRVRDFPAVSSTRRLFSDGNGTEVEPNESNYPHFV